MSKAFIKDFSPFTLLFSELSLFYGVILVHLAAVEKKKNPDCRSHKGSFYSILEELPNCCRPSETILNLKRGLFYTPRFIQLSSHQPALHSEWVTLLFTIFQIPSQVFGLAGCAAFSLAITGLQAFSNGAFEEITLFSLSSREKKKKRETFGPQLAQSITRVHLKFCLTHLAAKILP